MATAHQIGNTILAIRYPDLWLGYFENARSVRRMYENEGGLPKDHWYGESNCILAEDVEPGGQSFEPIGPRFVELGDSVSGYSQDESPGRDPHLPETKKSPFAVAITKQHALLAATLTSGLVIGALTLITWAWNKLKTKKRETKPSIQRRHPRQWSVL